MNTVASYRQLFLDSGHYKPAKAVFVFGTRAPQFHQGAARESESPDAIPEKHRRRWLEVKERAATTTEQLAVFVCAACLRGLP